MTSPDKMKIVYRKTSSLIPYEGNARIHPPEQIEQIRASIREFGFRNPILLKDDNKTIGAGHGRWEAAKAEGLAMVPTITLTGLSEAQWRAYIIADNKIASSAQWNFELLRVELGELKGLDIDLQLTGFLDGELKTVFLERDFGKTDPEAEWVGMPEYEGLDPCFRRVVVNFDTPEAVSKFFALIEQNDTGKTKSIWFPYKERRDLKDSSWDDSLGGDDEG